MNKYELKHIRGIPYYINGTTVYTFELTGGNPSEQCVDIGTYNETNNTITYHDNWRERTQSRLNHFREHISAQERDKLRETITKPVKQEEPHVIREKLPAEPRILRVHKEDITMLCQIIKDFHEQIHI